MNIAITGGGTGGHLTIAKSLAEQCQKNGYKTIFIGSNSGQDKEWFLDSSLFDKTYFLDTSGVVNKKGIGILKAVFKQIKAIFTARSILKKHEIQALICVGGFSAGGASMAAILFRIPLFIHEQNATSGLLNTILAPFAKATFSSFNHPRHIATSYPIDISKYNSFRCRTDFHTLLILGGSQGAKALNDFTLSIAKDLISQGKKIIHQCGSADYSRVKNEYEKQNILDSITLFAFDKNIEKYISMSDIALCRAGASSVWECASNGLPCIYIPYPFAAKNHQEFNARFFSDKGLGEMILQHQLNQTTFFDSIANILSNIESISQQLHASIKPDGVENILKYIRQNVIK